MRLCFLVAAHLHPELLARILDRLDDGPVSFFVHVDKSADIRPFRAALSRKPNVRFVPRESSRWGSFGQVQATLSLLRDAVRRSPDSERFLLISGQDYPLMGPARMAEVFERNQSADWINAVPLPRPEWKLAGGLDRLRRYHFFSRFGYFSYPSETVPDRRLLRVAYWICKLLLPANRSLPEGIALYGGTSWWNLTRASSERLLEFVEGNPGFVRRFRFTRCADEIFFQTALAKACPSTPRVQDDLRCAFWDDRWHRRPAVVRVPDFDEIAESGKLFVRKVHPEHSGALMDKIDRELLGC